MSRGSVRVTVITLDIWARTTTAGVGYACPITVTSSAQPTIRDTAVAKMSTCLRNCSGAKPEPSEVRR